MIHLAIWLAPLLQAGQNAEGPPPGGLPGCGGGSSYQMLIMMGLVFVIFYFLIIRPGQKREKDRQAMLSAIKPGDTIITAGGLIGRVTGTAERHVVVEISPKVRVKVLRSQISGKDQEAEDKPQKSGKKSKG